MERGERDITGVSSPVMAQILKYRLLHRLRYHHRHRLFIPIESPFRLYSSSNAEMHPPEFSGMNAYDILGVSSTSSFAEIKASFRNLAKETHPDLAQYQDSSHASDKFIQILAAYEVPFFLPLHVVYACQISRIYVDGLLFTLLG